MLNGAGFTAGFCESAFQLDGVDDRIYLGAGIDPVIRPAITHSFTLQAWVNADDSRDQQIFWIGDAFVHAENTFISGRLLPNGAIVFAHRTNRDDATTKVVASPADMITAGRWHHLAFVRDFGNVNNGLQIFVDGQMVATGVDNLNPLVLGDPRPLTLGFRDDGGVVRDSHFDGLLDEVTLHNRALAATEIAAYVQACSNAAPTAVAGSDVISECRGALTEVVLNGSFSSDPDGDLLEFEWSVPAESGAVLDDPTSPTPTGQFPLGPTLVTLTITDGKGGIDIDDVLVTVEDTTPPVLVCTTDAIALLPPNHSYRTVGICIAVSDNCANPQALLIHCTISSSEPDDANGDGAFTGDVNGQDGYSNPVDISQALEYDPVLGCYVAEVSLRAERDGIQTGRVYSIVSHVLDTEGNSATASCVVVVPHDRRRN